MLPNKAGSSSSVVQTSKDKHIPTDLSKLSTAELTEVIDRQNKLLSRSGNPTMLSEDRYVGSKVVAAVELLNHFSVDELKMILNDGSKFDGVMKDIIDCKDMETDKEVLIASNKSLAEYNLTKETVLRELKQDVVELSQSGESLYRDVEQKMNRVNVNSGPNNLEDILALLQSATATAEEQSEALVQAFLNGTNDVDSFLEQFITARKLMHLRRVKSDKMKEMVQRSVTRTQPINPQPPSMFYPVPNNSVPYPVGPSSAMPFPNQFNNYF